MKATLKQIVFMGQAGVGVYINGGLSTFIVRAVDLLDKLDALKAMGYKVEIDNEYDETELEDEMVLDELEDEAWLTVWELV